MGILDEMCVCVCVYLDLSSTCGFGEKVGGNRFFVCGAVERSRL